MLTLTPKMKPQSVDSISTNPLYEHADRFGIRDIAPNESYRLIYREPESSRLPSSGSNVKHSLGLAGFRNRRDA
jgi:hypothetical protein